MEDEDGGGFRIQTVAHPVSTSGVCILSMKPARGYREHAQACCFPCIDALGCLLRRFSILMHILD